MKAKKKYCSQSSLLATICYLAVIVLLSQPVEAQSKTQGGKVEGTMIPAAKVGFKKEDNTVEIENFTAYPARMTGVQRNR